MGIEGGSKKLLQAKEMVKDLAKFNKFVCPESVNFEAGIVVPLGIYSMLKSYIECVRQEGEAEDPVFLTNNGNPVSKAGNELENLARSLNEELPLTPSLNRKILATTAAANLEDDQLRVVKCLH